MSISLNNVNSEVARAHRRIDELNGSLSGFKVIYRGSASSFTRITLPNEWIELNVIHSDDNTLDRTYNYTYMITRTALDIAKHFSIYEMPKYQNQQDYGELYYNPDNRILSKGSPWNTDNEIVIAYR